MRCVSRDWGVDEFGVGLLSGWFCGFSGGGSVSFQEARRLGAKAVHAVSDTVSSNSIPEVSFKIGRFTMPGIEQSSYIQRKRIPFKVYHANLSATGREITEFLNSKSETLHWNYEVKMIGDHVENLSFPSMMTAARSIESCQFHRLRAHSEKNRNPLSSPVVAINKFCQRS